MDDSKIVAFLINQERARERERKRESVMGAKGPVLFAGG